MGPDRTPPARFEPGSRELGPMLSSSPTPPPGGCHHRGGTSTRKVNRQHGRSPRPAILAASRSRRFRRTDRRSPSQALCSASHPGSASFPDSSNRPPRARPCVGPFSAALWRRLPAPGTGRFRPVSPKMFLWPLIGRAGRPPPRSLLRPFLSENPLEVSRLRPSASRLRRLSSIVLPSPALLREGPRAHPPPPCSP